MSYFFVGFSTGKWTQDTCRELIFGISRTIEWPKDDEKVQFFSDGNDDYMYIIPEYFRRLVLEYGQPVKIRDNGKVVDKERRVIYGSPDADDIETTDVENFNGILRERIGRLVRKTKCFSKLKRRLDCSLHLFRFYWNFINDFKRGTTPAMLEGLAAKQWNWHEFFFSLTIPK